MLVVVFVGKMVVYCCRNSHWLQHIILSAQHVHGSDDSLLFSLLMLVLSIQSFVLCWMPFESRVLRQSAKTKRASFMLRADIPLSNIFTRDMYLLNALLIRYIVCFSQQVTRNSTTMILLI